ncbi:MAG: hypothetical protein JW957_00985 [Candidatus Omnitrophica bacterium]|nr:hypothetical protein [Candidatus Omnitrophota bacterium]
MERNKFRHVFAGKPANRIPLIILALLLLASGKGFAEWPAWIEKEKIRGGYQGGYIDSDEHFARLAAHGINTLLLSFASLDIDATDEIALMKKQADRCSGLGLHMFVCVRLCGDKAELRYLVPGGRCYVGGKGGALTKTPCPVDPVFWDNVVTKRAQLAAEHSLMHKIDGFALDPEMYSADMANFPGYCYCEYCFREFFQHRGLQVDVPSPEKRSAWLKDNGLLETYQRWQEEQAQGLAVKTMQAVHKINPGMVIGVLSLDDRSWYSNAWARGFGSPEMPVIAFSENTYSTGADKYLVRTKEHFKLINANALLCPGMWLRQFKVSDIASQLFYMAQDTAGYWVFTTYGLVLPPEEVPTNHYTWLPPHQQYLDAFLLAGKELDRQAKEGDAFVPKLKLASRQETPRSALENAGLLGPAPAELIPLDPAGQESRPMQEATRLRYQAVFYIPAAAGGNIKARLSAYKEGDSELMPVYGLLSPCGKVAAEGMLSFENPVLLDVPAEETGLYKLALAGRHSYSAAIDMPHAVQSVNDTVSAVKHTAVMYFYVPPDCAEFFIKASTPYAAERAKLTVWDSDGKEAAAAETFETTPAIATLHPAPDQRGKVWSFRMIPSYSVNLAWDDRLPPYLSESPESLMLPAGKKNASEPDKKGAALPGTQTEKGVFIRLESNSGDYVAVNGVYDYATVKDGIRDVILPDGEHTLSYYRAEGIKTYYEAKITVEKGTVAKIADTARASSWRIADSATVSSRGPDVKIIGKPGQSIYYGRLNGPMSGSTAGEAEIRLSEGDWVIYCSDWTDYYWARITIAGGVVESVDDTHGGGKSGWRKVDDTTVSIR